MDSTFLTVRESSIFVYSISAIISLGLMVVARRFAIRVSLSDKPNERKRHLGEIPLAGGLMLMSSLLMQAIGLYYDAGALPKIVFLCSLLFLVGLLDDLMELRVSLRLLMQIGVTLCLVYWVGIELTSLGYAVGSKYIYFSGFLVPLFTCVGVIGVINAVNMIDGIDGLLGTTATISLLAIALLAGSGRHAVELNLVLMLAGACSAFLLFNVGDFGLRRPAFMGDSGSLVIGFLIAVVLISLSQGIDRAFEPVVAGWLVGWPLLDTVSVMVRRIVSGHSPFRADRDHSHHALLACGFSSRATLCILTSVHALMVGFGLMAHFYLSMPAWVYFWLFVALTVAHFFLLPRLGAVVKAGRSAARLQPGSAR